MAQKTQHREMNLRVSDSFYDFLYNNRSTNRIARVLYRCINWQGARNVTKLAITTEHVNYLTLRGDGTISYLPKGKEHVVNDGRWARDNRQNGRPATIIKKLLTPKAQKLFKDTEYEAFVNSYKSECDREKVTFYLRPNVEIPDVYDMRRESGGTLGDSCMNGDVEYLDIYKYCKDLRILTLVNGEGLLSGRALVWNVKIDGEDAVFLDRFYVAKDHYCELFIEYANDNGWWRKKQYTSQANKTSWIKNGVNRDFFITIHTPTEFDYYPYIDTFCYGGDGWLSNDEDKDREYEYVQTGGEREYRERIECAVCNEYIDEDDAVYIQRGRYNNQYIHRDYAVYCETDCLDYYEQDDNIVEVDNRWYRYDDENIVEVEGDWYRTDSSDIVYSDFHEEHILNDNAVYSEHHESHIKDDEAYEVAGQYFHESVVNKVA